MSGMNLSWETVKARSLSKDQRDRATFCADCFFLFRSGGVPCLKHTLDSEQEARADVIREAEIHATRAMGLFR